MTRNILAYLGFNVRTAKHRGSFTLTSFFA